MERMKDGVWQNKGTLRRWHFNRILAAAAVVGAFHRAFMVIIIDRYPGTCFLSNQQTFYLFDFFMTRACMMTSLIPP